MMMMIKIMLLTIIAIVPGDGDDEEEEEKVVMPARVIMWCQPSVMMKSASLIRKVELYAKYCNDYAKNNERLFGKRATF